MTYDKILTAGVVTFAVVACLAMGASHALVAGCAKPCPSQFPSMAYDGAVPDAARSLDPGI